MRGELNYISKNVVISSIMFVEFIFITIPKNENNLTH